ncbi:MAG: transposase [Pontibacterium sp.]
MQARLKLAKAHERLASARADFQHKLSRQLIDENQAVIVETLKVKAYSRTGSWLSTLLTPVGES